MSIYQNRDVASSIEGDIELDSKGDLNLANSLETYKAAANFVLRSDFGDYAADKTVGCNLGSFIGLTNTPENHEFMEYNINKVLKERLFSTMDANATVVPFDMNEVLCVVNIGGSYLIDGIIQTINGETLVYLFPYIE